MRKANWKIDYENEVLYLSNNSEAFPFTDQAKFIELSNKKWGNKHLNISVNGIEDSYTFDTGFSGFIQNDLKFYDKLMSKDSTLDFVSLRGLLSADLYGATFSETHLFIFDSLSLGAVTIQDQRMKMKKKGSSLIGNQFFEAFDLTMDWDNNRLILDPIKGFEADTIKAFEVLIAPNYAETSLEVKGDWLIDTDLKIKMGSKVVEVNGKDVSSFTKEELCDYWDNQWKDIIKGEKLEIMVLEDEVEKNYTLTKRQYLPY
ncbi:MAG: hypothetical protein ACPGVI_06615, partial [Crocinitomicaceae bacterium]